MSEDGKDEKKLSPLQRISRRVAGALSRSPTKDNQTTERPSSTGVTSNIQRSSLGVAGAPVGASAVNAMTQRFPSSQVVARTPWRRQSHSNRRSSYTPGDSSFLSATARRNKRRRHEEQVSIASKEEIDRMLQQTNQNIIQDRPRVDPSLSRPTVRSWNQAGQQIPTESRMPEEPSRHQVDVEVNSEEAPKKKRARREPPQSATQTSSQEIDVDGDGNENHGSDDDQIDLDATPKAPAWMLVPDFPRFSVDQVAQTLPSSDDPQRSTMPIQNPTEIEQETLVYEMMCKAREKNKKHYTTDEEDEKEGRTGQVALDDWECTTCTATNSALKSKCHNCGKTRKTGSWGSGFGVYAWKCQVCGTQMQDDKVKKCLSCETPRPDAGSSVSNASNGASTNSGTAVPTANRASNGAITDSGFQFGAPTASKSSDTGITPGGFTFKAATKSTTDSTPAPSTSTTGGFQFGVSVPPAATGPSGNGASGTSSGFHFGAPAASTQASNGGSANTTPGGFRFGATAPSSTTSATQESGSGGGISISAASSGFQFGTASVSTATDSSGNNVASGGLGATVGAPGASESTAPSDKPSVGGQDISADKKEPDTESKPPAAAGFHFGTGSDAAASTSITAPGTFSFTGAPVSGTSSTPASTSKSNEQSVTGAGALGGFASTGSSTAKVSEPFKFGQTSGKSSGGPAAFTSTSAPAPVAPTGFGTAASNTGPGGPPFSFGSQPLVEPPAQPGTMQSVASLGDDNGSPRRKRSTPSEQEPSRATDSAGSQPPSTTAPVATGGSTFGVGLNAPFTSGSTSAQAPTAGPPPFGGSNSSTAAPPPITFGGQTTTPVVPPPPFGGGNQAPSAQPQSFGLAGQPFSSGSSVPATAQGQNATSGFSSGGNANPFGLSSASGPVATFGSERTGGPINSTSFGGFPGPSQGQAGVGFGSSSSPAPAFGGPVSGSSGFGNPAPPSIGGGISASIPSSSGFGNAAPAPSLGGFGQPSAPSFGGLGSAAPPQQGGGGFSMGSAPAPARGGRRIVRAKRPGKRA